MICCGRASGSSRSTVVIVRELGDRGLRKMGFACVADALLRR